MFFDTLHVIRGFPRLGWVWALALATSTTTLLAQHRSAGQLTLVEDYSRQPDGRRRVLYSLTLLADTLPPSPVRTYFRQAKQPIRIRPDWTAEPFADDTAPPQQAPFENKPDARFFKPGIQPSGTVIWSTLGLHP